MIRLISMDDATEFKKELKALLEKYQADIYVDLDGDTHGVSCSIVFDIKNKEIMRSNNDISANDIKI